MTRPFLMTYRRDWYDCGRVADGFSWPLVIEANGSGKVLSYEKDWATMIGCSGYVTYVIQQAQSRHRRRELLEKHGKTWFTAKSLLKP